MGDGKYKLENPHVPEGAYLEGLELALGVMARHLSDTQLHDLVVNKLRLTDPEAKEESYIQAACELTVNAFFARNYSNTFRYEPKLNGKKNVECAFEHAGITVNVEVKCPEMTKRHDHAQKDVFTYRSSGRLDGMAEFIERFNPIMNSGPDGKPFVPIPHFDNKLKDYLEGAHDKFPATRGDHELNVLVVCCDDHHDAADWWGYMFGSKGLLTLESYVDSTRYSRVDIVMLTNLYHRHYRPTTKPRITGHWHWPDAFSLLFANASRSSDREHVEAQFGMMVPHYTREFVAHPPIPGIPDAAAAYLHIPCFVAQHFFSNGLYPFEPSETNKG